MVWYPLCNSILNDHFILLLSKHYENKKNSAFNNFKTGIKNETKSKWIEWEWRGTKKQPCSCNDEKKIIKKKLGNDSFQDSKFKTTNILTEQPENK